MEAPTNLDRWIIYVLMHGEAIKYVGATRNAVSRKSSHKRNHPGFRFIPLVDVRTDSQTAKTIETSIMAIMKLCGHAKFNISPSVTRSCVATRAAKKIWPYIKRGPQSGFRTQKEYTGPVYRIEI